MAAKLYRFNFSIFFSISDVTSHSRSKQRTDQRVLVLTLKFLALKITGFSLVKNTSQNFFDFCLSLFYATFQCGPYNIFKKKLNLLFTHKKYFPISLTFVYLYSMQLFSANPKIFSKNSKLIFCP